MSHSPHIIPNILTLTRILAIPLLLSLHLLATQPAHQLIAIVFLLASLTDWLDGFLARRYHWSTPLGAFLDPVADKLLVTAALMIMVFEYKNPWLFAFSVIIISREITVSALREWMATRGKSAQLKVKKIAKIKTAMQMLGIFLLLIHLNTITFNIGSLALLIATLLTLYSMIQYLQIAAKDLTFIANPT